MFIDDSTTNKQLETLEELDWCLIQLENMQSHKTISDIASTKFKKMLNKELSHFAEHNKSDNQIAEYICNTYLDKKEDIIELPNNNNSSSKLDQNNVTPSAASAAINSGSITTVDQSGLVVLSRNSNNNLNKLPTITIASATSQTQVRRRSSLVVVDDVLFETTTTNSVESILVNNSNNNNNNETNNNKNKSHQSSMNNIFSLNNLDNLTKNNVSRYDIEIKNNKELDNVNLFIIFLINFKYNNRNNLM